MWNGEGLEVHFDFPDTCYMCGYHISPDGYYQDSVLWGLFGYTYFGWQCWKWHIDSK